MSYSTSHLFSWWLVGWPFGWDSAPQFIWSHLNPLCRAGKQGGRASGVSFTRWEVTGPCPSSSSRPHWGGAHGSLAGFQKGGQGMQGILRPGSGTGLKLLLPPSLGQSPQTSKIQGGKKHTTWDWWVFQVTPHRRPGKGEGRNLWPLCGLPQALKATSS